MPFIRPVGQAVKTPPFHGGNMGSIPVRVTMNKIPMLLHWDFFIIQDPYGNRKAVKKTVRWTVFRPREIPMPLKAA